MINRAYIVYLGYSETPCPECYRFRVELWSDGHEECEVCGWCPDENRYLMEWERRS